MGNWKAILREYDKIMKYVEQTSKILYNLVRANSSTQALKIRLSTIFAHFITRDWFYVSLYLIILHKLKYRLR